MKNYRLRFLWVVLILLLANHETPGRGFGGFGGFRGGFGGFHSYGGYGGFRSYGSYGGFRGGGYGGFREGGYGYSGYRSSAGAWGERGGFAGSSYERSYTGARGGSISAEGSRGVAYGPRGVAAGGTREVTASGPGGRSFSGESGRGFAAGAGGGFAAGGYRSGIASGPGGTVAGGSRWGAAGIRFPSDCGLAHYANVGVASAGHVTACWSNGSMAARANWVRAGWSNWGCFGRGWFVGHPGAWGYGIVWAAGNPWTWTAWPVLTSWCGVAATPIYYDYGTNVVYQGDSVYVNGSDADTAQQYSEQASAIAAQGSQADPPATEKWQPLGVFALVQGDETTSNTIFQLAVNQTGILRGNYFDALTDATTPVKGAVDKKTQRAAWTIGDQKNTVFETGIFNLTMDKTPCLVHTGKDRTQQWLLVRLSKPEQN
jgi:hypothetical protein